MPFLAWMRFNILFDLFDYAIFLFKLLAYFISFSLKMHSSANLYFYALSFFMNNSPMSFQSMNLCMK
ncbi:hypothetical protein KFK09_027257 [Dendrobium nobile]|uniref:Uncharacterized protein n=1 Tax=Dendrobium nobile TaxID=94219 RepID=A0A8T3AAL3_DENNO|nr:hypothetical protein KFK09_027257 [Dendrobium nobile]